MVLRIPGCSGIYGRLLECGGSLLGQPEGNTPNLVVLGRYLHRLHGIAIENMCRFIVLSLDPYLELARLAHNLLGLGYICPSHIDEYEPGPHSLYLDVLQPQAVELGVENPLGIEHGLIGDPLYKGVLPFRNPSSHRSE